MNPDTSVRERFEERLLGQEARDRVEGMPLAFSQAAFDKIAAAFGLSDADFNKKRGFRITS